MLDYRDWGPNCKHHAKLVYFGSCLLHLQFHFIPTGPESYLAVRVYAVRVHTSPYRSLASTIGILCVSKRPVWMVAHYTWSHVVHLYFGCSWDCLRPSNHQMNYHYSRLVLTTAASLLQLVHSAQHCTSSMIDQNTVKPLYSGHSMLIRDLWTHKILFYATGVKGCT